MTSGLVRSTADSKDMKKHEMFRIFQVPTLSAVSYTKHSASCGSILGDPIDRRQRTSSVLPSPGSWDVGVPTALP